ncbi:MAG: NAD(P)-dependent alcohol dehydrogenase [Flavobacteriales bacterium]|nr:NAD(P)-dependent alcohol dehydrogenase [Flavobacteriales bacterium]
MKAIVCTKYGAPDVLELQEVRKPIPKENEVLIKVVASSVTTADTMMRKGSPYFGRLFIGLLKPKNSIPGTGFSGRVDALGKSVSLFKKGDEVFGESLFYAGTNAVYLCVAEDGIILTKPGNMSHEQAAPVCDGALTSINFLKEIANVKPGQSVLINGASGSLGTAAVQLAKYYGAKVTGVCSQNNMSLLKSLGADDVIDYTKQDFTKNENRYDVIYDTIGKSSFSACKKALKESGKYLSPVLSISLLFQMLRTSIMGKKKALFAATGLKPVAELKLLLKELKIMIEESNLISVMDQTYSLDKIVDAHRYIETGRKKGNVVIALEREKRNKT